MAFQISPGVNVSEVDLTTVVPSVSTTAGAFAGAFVWGPANKRVTINNEVNLVERFGKPDANTYESFFTAANFLAYGNNLKVVRAVSANAFNSTANPSAEFQCNNEDVFEENYLSNNNSGSYGPYMGRYPGNLGNSLKVSVADSSNWSTWAYKSYFTGAPGTSSQADAGGSSNDELHVIVIDEDGYFTGTQNTVLEVFPFLSKGLDAIDAYGNSAYYKQYIFQNSSYIYAVDPVDYANSVSTWGGLLSNGISFRTIGSATTNAWSLSGGVDENPTDGNLETAYDLFANGDEVDVSLMLTGSASTTVQGYVGNIAISRKDCLTFVSPPKTAVVNNAGSEVDDITTWNTSLLATLGSPTNYVVADSGWKYQFDKYNNVYRYVPLNADIAGLCVYTDTIRDPWFSPAGFNRGNIKNAIKLSWNPTKTDRDNLYAIAVNPVATFQGQGTVLYGDKTLQLKPSAFDRINVRRLFIVLEKSISTAAKYSLFEFNDEFTRNQFVSMVTPFLREVQGRRGIYDFRVVCDTTNNTPQVIDSNQFVGDIYVKPARSINYIQLNFVAVRTGVDFTEVVGNF